jgi:hypothetical protein
VDQKSFELEAPRNAELYLDIAYSYKRCKLRAKNSKFVKDLYMMYEAKFMQASTENLAIKDRTPLKRAASGNAFNTRAVRRRMYSKGAVEKPNGAMPSRPCPLPSASSKNNGKGVGCRNLLPAFVKIEQEEPEKEHTIIFGKPVLLTPHKSGKVAALVVKFAGGESNFVPPPPVKA